MAEALALIEERGVEQGLNVKLIAQRAGTSPTAPYVHFPGRADQLLAAVAIEGFRDLNIRLAGAQHSDPAQRTRLLVLEYVGFGVTRQGIYRAMFHARLADHLEGLAEEDAGAATYMELAELKAHAFELVCAPVQALAAAGLMEPAAVHDAGLTLAALAHGLVGEFIDEGLGKRESGGVAWSALRQDMTSRMTDMLLHGILLDDSARGRASSMAADPSWSRYQDTILELFDYSSIVVDLRKPIPDDQRRLIERSVLGDRFAVLTAYNPKGRTQDQELNEDADRLLIERVEELGVPWVRADGVSPEGRHREAGIAAPLDQRLAKELATEFGQSAFFWYDQGVVWLVGALVDAAPIRLGQ